MTIDRIEIDPLSNLIFTRDQQIITARGLVMGNTQTTVRRFEKVVMKAVFKQLNIPLIGEATQSTSSIMQINLFREEILWQSANNCR